MECPLNKCPDCNKEISRSAKRCKPCANINRTGKYKHSNINKLGAKNPMWKGDDVKKAALHDWIEDHKPRVALCEECNIAPPLDLANVSGLYKRDINDFRWLCRKCHMLSDGRLKNLKQYQVKTEEK